MATDKGTFAFMSTKHTLTTTSTAFYGFPETTLGSGGGKAVLPFDGTLKAVLINTGGGLPLGSGGAFSISRRPNGTLLGNQVVASNQNITQTTAGVFEIVANASLSKGDEFSWQCRIPNLATFSITLQIEYDLVN